MRALVTGGAGFIGSTIVDLLIERGDEVDVIDNFVTGRASNVEAALANGARVHEIDIRDRGSLQAAFDKIKPDAVFHLAAQIDVRRSIEDPAFDADVNVAGTINVLEAARKAGVRRVVNTSTGGAIYGDADMIPTPETEEPLPMSAYGQSKYCAERYLRWQSRLYGSSNVTLRLGNVYGPRQDPLGEAGVIAIFCGKVLEGGTATIYGDGTQTRDYTFVGDVAAAQLAAAASDIDGEVNVGTGQETSVLDLVNILGTLRPEAGFTPQFADARAGELQRSCLDVSRAGSDLGWQAEVPLDEGLRRTLDSLT